MYVAPPLLQVLGRRVEAGILFGGSLCRVQLEQLLPDLVLSCSLFFVQLFKRFLCLPSSLLPPLPLHLGLLPHYCDVFLRLLRDKLIHNLRLIRKVWKNSLNFYIFRFRLCQFDEAPLLLVAILNANLCLFLFFVKLSLSFLFLLFSLFFWWLFPPVQETRRNSRPFVLLLL